MRSTRQGGPAGSVCQNFLSSVSPSFFTLQSSHIPLSIDHLSFSRSVYDPTDSGYNTKEIPSLVDKQTAGYVMNHGGRRY